MQYLIRLILEVESRGWAIEIGCEDAYLPTSGTSIAFNIFGKPFIFDVSMAVFYPGTDLPSVVVTKPVSVMNEDMIHGIAASLASVCDGERLVYRHCEEVLQPS